MTRFLKLVRHQDGKWKALSAETDELSEEISVKEKTYAPIDPHQLLKALDNHLSTTGGIKSIKDVPRLASLMKKFSRKLVSRCVYCNVLQATEPDILSEYLDKGGWETINLWLQYAKSTSSSSFLIEMLKLCKQLPMTLERLKENNTAKLIKSLTKHESEDVKTMSVEVVTKWMTIIKEKKSAETAPGEKKKKKEKLKHDIEKPDSKVQTKAESPKGAGKIKGIKRTSSEKEKKKVEYYEDVKIDPEPLLPLAKKPKSDRPKTVKIFQKKFRATGLEEETPLPKAISKKTNIDKSTVVAAAKSALKTNQPNPTVPERVTEKKIKPESLMTINETSTANKGIKLIPAKPKPTYVLHESASFMDALISQPVAPVKKRKKPQSPKAANSPTSPTLIPPKLQFYKDTLETSEDSKKDENQTDSNEENIKTDPTVSNVDEGDEPMDISTEEGGRTPPNDDSSNTVNLSEEAEDNREGLQQSSMSNPNQLRSILSHGRRRGSKKSVRWVEDSSIKEVFYFELDETERVNVLRNQNFGDMKSIELKREREALELAKRQAGDRMEEMIRWWAIPIYIDVPMPAVEPGCQSREREIEKIRQQSTLQEIYFTREMIPDSPHEPDLEIVPPQEPKQIPRDEENIIGLFTDHSNVKIQSLPEVLSTLTSLVRSNRTLLPLPNNEQVPNEPSLLPQSIINSSTVIQPNVPLGLTQPYDPAEPPVPMLAQTGLIGGSTPIISNIYNVTSPSDTQNIPPPGDWQSQYYGGNYQVNSSPEHIPSMNQGLNLNQIPPMNQGPVAGMNQGSNVNHGHGMNQGPNNMNQGPGMNSGPNINQGPNMNQGPPMRPRMMQDSYRPHRNPPRGGGPRGARNAHRVPCRHFIANGCRFGMKCTFLHPGVNGPRL